MEEIMNIPEGVLIMDTENLVSKAINIDKYKYVWVNVKNKNVCNYVCADIKLINERIIIAVHSPYTVPKALVPYIANKLAFLPTSEMSERDYDIYLNAKENFDVKKKKMNTLKYRVMNASIDISNDFE